MGEASCSKVRVSENRCYRGDRQEKKRGGGEGEKVILVTLQRGEVIVGGLSRPYSSRQV